jgi:RNA-directed DNA polymerase
MTKQFDIPKQLVMDSYKLVKANAGAAGVDLQTLEDFEKDLKSNLYKIWNRMSSGSYFPPPVKGVSIPKKSGGNRILGIPTVSDRIAQMVVKLTFEPLVEPYFLNDSYGYRPNKSALDAIGVTRQRCWRNDWVLEFDIKGLFDNIPHDLMMKAVRAHTKCKWIVLYIKRWLTAPIKMPDGNTLDRSCGTPQGGVISPVLSNLFLHYVFDKWMQRNHPRNKWCRYADDGLVHCKTRQQAQQLLCDLEQRFLQCGLELHPAKTKIVYCKDGKRKGNHINHSFDFLGYTFRQRVCKSKDGNLFVGFNPAVSKSALKSMRAKTKKLNWRNRSELSLNDIAKRYNPVLQGWLNYYGKYNCSSLYSVWGHSNKTLISWAMLKYKPLRKRKTRARRFLEKICESNPSLFVHWKYGVVGELA